MKLIEMAGVLIPNNPRAIAGIINDSYPLISSAGNVISTDTVRRLLKSGDIASVNSYTHIDSIDCFIDGDCDTSGIETLAGGYGYSYDQMARLVKKDDFPKVKLGKRYVYCTNSTDAYMDKYRSRRNETWNNNLNNQFWTNPT